MPIPATTNNPTLIDCEALAELLGVGVAWVRRKTQTREIPCVRLGRNVRFSAANVADIVEQFTQPAIRRTTARSRI